MAISIGQKIERFGQKIKSGAEKFGKKVGRDLLSAGKFVKEKALPEIEKLAGQAGAGIKKATPYIAGIAPELLPVAIGAGKLASAIGKGAAGGRKAIGQGEQTVEAIKRGDVKSAVMSGKALRRDLRI